MKFIYVSFSLSTATSNAKQQTFELWMWTIKKKVLKMKCKDNEFYLSIVKGSIDVLPIVSKHVLNKKVVTVKQKKNCVKTAKAK